MSLTIDQVKSWAIGIAVILIVGLIIYGLYLFWPAISGLFKLADMTAGATDKLVKRTTEATKFLTSKKTASKVGKGAKDAANFVTGKKKKKKKKKKKEKENFWGFNSLLNSNDHPYNRIKQNILPSNDLVIVKSYNPYFTTGYKTVDFGAKYYFDNNNRWDFIPSSNNYQYGNYYLENYDPSPPVNYYPDNSKVYHAGLEKSKKERFLSMQDLAY